MTFSLGIHVGHDTACALAKDGLIVGAIQQERLTRRKHDGHEALTNSLPVLACLATAGITMDRVDVITTSFQAASPGGFGLHQPLIAPEFDLFDPYDARHFVISHHLGHAWCAFGTSPFSEAAVLVCDLGGTSSVNGQDYDLSFAQWHTRMTSLDDAVPVRTETLSIYRATRRTMTLLDREYTIPHNGSASFVHSLASLYENVTGYIFEEADACGQLMALAAFGRADRFDPRRLAYIDEATASLRFRNDWQGLLPWRKDFQGEADLAHAVQKITEDGLLLHVRRAKSLTGLDSLAVAGGVFLNILANSRIAESRVFDRYHVPSAPHDAGIAVGCALHGHARLVGSLPIPLRPLSDRLGPIYTYEQIRSALLSHQHAIMVVAEEVSPEEVARRLADGTIIARWAGRSEFGPRALGGRSFLASPLRADVKDRLNAIKGRQFWRPVAPIVAAEAFSNILDGPCVSPYMSFTQRIQGRHIDALRALAHPDGTTRAQTIDGCDDPWLHSLLLCHQNLTGYALLVNTSLNGPGEVMAETPQDAIALFLRENDIDFLLLDKTLCARVDVEDRACPFRLRARAAEGAVLVCKTDETGERAFVVKGHFAIPIIDPTYDYLRSAARGDFKNVPPPDASGAVRRELWRMIDLGLVIYSDENDRR